MLNAADNELLTRTGADTPMGALFRRFWIPVLLSQELPEPDCPPARVTIMGEELVAFRDTEGRVGLVDPRCPHRGANLFFGRNEECGLRCLYHGWKFDVTGRCVDLPTLPPDRTFRERVRITAYPVREWGDFVWAYLGPAGALPEVPALEFALVPPAHRFVSKKLQQCNWAQAAEGGLDTAHFSFLHMPVTSSASESDEVRRGPPPPTPCVPAARWPTAACPSRTSCSSASATRSAGSGASPPTLRLRARRTARRRPP